MNKSEFKHIFDTYFDPLRSFVYYRTADEKAAEDIVQDVFMRLWEKRARLDNSNIKALLYKMASDMVVSHYRHEATKLEFERSLSYGQAISPEDELQFEELKARYAGVLKQMNEAQREVFLMSREESLKYHEIAERLGVSVKAVEKRMSQALQLLKSKLIYLLIWTSIL